MATIFRSLRSRRPLGLLTTPFWAGGTAMIINDYFYEIMSVYGISMVPTLSPLYHEEGRQDYLLLRKWRPTDGLQRGDVVSFWAPLKADKNVVKRVVALEGDLVYLDKRRRPKTEGPEGDLLRRDWDMMGAQDKEEGLSMITRPAVRVPYGHVWVEGDNWRESRDSNTYGPMSKSLITGRALCVVYPLEKFGSQPWQKVAGTTNVKEGKKWLPMEWQG